MNNGRKPYIDNIRSVTVIIVMIYHAFYIFNGVGVLGGFPVTNGVFIFDSFCTLVYPWFMVLLFCISGICARYSLEGRGQKEFIKERTCKLLIPSTLGVVVFHWIVGYINIKIGGGLEYIPEFLVYPIAVLSGSGPLWFAHLAFLYSVVIVLIQRIDKKDVLYQRFSRSGSIFLTLIATLLIWGSAQLFNMPIITVYRLGIYFVSFLIGYFVISHDEVQNKIEKILPLSLVLSIITGTYYMIKFNGNNFASEEVLKNLITNTYAWFSVLSILGLFKRYLNRHNAVSKYISANSFGYYVLHYPVVLTVGYCLYYLCELPLILTILLTLTAELIIVAAITEMVKRIPFIRFILLGKRGKGNEFSTNN